MWPFCKWELCIRTNKIPLGSLLFLCDYYVNENVKELNCASSWTISSWKWQLVESLNFFIFMLNTFYNNNLIFASLVFNAYCVVLLFLRLVYPMLSVSLHCPFLIAPSAFSIVYCYPSTYSSSTKAFNKITSYWWFTIALVGSGTLSFNSPFNNISFQLYSAG
jgi:hypothetical protein